ncbi:MAG: hypothetical protein WBA93_15975 [Microcoleaceae cyanobacterium]
MISLLQKPTIFYRLVDEYHQVQQFKEKDLINKSLIFPELNLTAKQIFQVQR